MATARDSRAQVPATANRQRDAEPQPAKPYRILYSLLLIVTYLSVMIDLFLLVLTHGPAVALKVALGLLIVCACLSLTPFILFVSRSRKTNAQANLRTLWNLYTWQRAGRTERIITAAVFATVMIALALIVSHGYFR